MADTETASPKGLEQHVLCVDDDHEFLSSLQFFLPERINRGTDGQVWYRFLFFESPKEALRTLQELQGRGETVAMVISDQKMPQMKGTELLTNIKRRSPETIRVLLTGHAGLESAILAINDQLLDKYVTKPIDDEHDFVVSIVHLLQNYQMKATIAHQTKIIQDLYEFANTLNSTQDFQETLNCLVAFTRDGLQCERILVMLLEDDTLRIRAAFCGGEAGLELPKIPIDEADVRHHFQACKVGLGNTAQDIPYLRLSHGAQSRILFEMPVLYAGLCSAGRFFGVIHASWKVGNLPFTESDRHYLSQITETASIAIQNQMNRLRLEQAYLTTKTQAEELEYQATHDSLTALPNRTRLRTCLQQAILGSRRERKQAAVLLMDLNRFKEINDTLSHHHGDRILQQVGTRVRALLRESDTIARLGGDEFAVLLPDTGEEGAILAARKIVAALEPSFVLDGVTIEVGAAMGIAVFPDHGRDADTLIQRADIAMYVAKQAGQEYFVYTSERDHYSAPRLALLGELRHAISHEQVVLHYQPKIGLRTGRVSGVEGLVRWYHPTRGVITPDQFVHLAEQTGLIKPLTLWALTAALRQWRTWHHAGVELRIAVNISARNLQDPALPKQVESLLQVAGVAPRWLELEITESSIMSDPTRALDVLATLKELGVTLSIDDFGSGYSSLAYLRRLPVETIKIDKAFVLNMVNDHDSAVIVRSTVELAHTLGLNVVAEGVETQETWEALAALGCDAAQGYHMSEPLSAEALGRWFKESPWGLSHRPRRLDSEAA